MSSVLFDCYINHDRRLTFCRRASSDGDGTWNISKFQLVDQMCFIPGANEGYNNFENVEYVKKFSE